MRLSVCLVCLFLEDQDGKTERGWDDGTRDGWSGESESLRRSERNTRSWSDRSWMAWKDRKKGWWTTRLCTLLLYCSAIRAYDDCAGHMNARVRSPPQKKLEGSGIMMGFSGWTVLPAIGERGRAGSSRVCSETERGHIPGTACTSGIEFFS